VQFGTVFPNSVTFKDASNSQGYIVAEKEVLFEAISL